MWLLTEETIAITTDILQKCKGSLRMEWEGLDCELHLTAVTPIEEEAKAEFIGASMAKANASVKGLTDKISASLAGMICNEDYPDRNAMKEPCGQLKSSARYNISILLINAVCSGSLNRGIPTLGIERSRP